jgi:hypothetical protein
MITTMLIVVLAAPGSEEARDHPRARAAIAGCMTAGRGFGRSSLGGGLGVSAELGVITADRLSFVARLTFGTVASAGTLTLGVGSDYVLEDHWSVGLGLALGYIGNILLTDVPNSWSFAAPFRVVYAQHERAEGVTARTGLMLFVELTAGFEFGGSQGRVVSPPPLGPPVSLAAALGVGYAWW